jgi:polyisoprenoid-binding protein YceI
MLHLALAAVLAIDSAKSTVTFSVQHIFVERVTGGVPVLSGAVDLPDGSAVPLSVTAVLDATKLKTGDPDRDGVMGTPEWFDTKKFPTWTFASTKITPAANGFTMDGMLTIHGVAQPEHMVVTASGDPQHPVYHATCQVDRHAFGMSVTRLDPVIGGTVDVTLDIRVKQP